MKVLKLISDLSIGRILILALFCTFAYYMLYFEDGSNLKNSIATVEGSIQAESARRVEIEKVMKKEEEMRGNLLQLARNLEVVKSKIPNEFKDTQMSAIINEASSSSGVSVIELRSQESGLTSAPPSPPTGEALRPEDLIEEVRFTIKLTGKYESFLAFLDVLSKEDKIIKVRNFKIKKNSESIDDDLILFEGEVVGFKQAAALLNNQTVPSATAPPEGGG